MTMDRPVEYLVSLVRELCKLPRETEWVEFKVNVHEPQEVGEYLSALANSAALAGKAFAYLLWGIADRQRFGIEPQNIAKASRLIGEAVEAGVIVADDPAAAPKLMRYAPAWAVPDGRPFT